MTGKRRCQPRARMTVRVFLMRLSLRPPRFAASAGTSATRSLGAVSVTLDGSLAHVNLARRARAGYMGEEFHRTPGREYQLQGERRTTLHGGKIHAVDATGKRLQYRDLFEPASDVELSA